MYAFQQIHAVMSKAHNSAPLVFVDTNIFLDGYKAANDIQIKFLQKLTEIKPALIISCQVEAEFKRNRQGCIADTLASLDFGEPKTGLINAAFLSDDEEVKAVMKELRELSSKVKKLKQKLEGFLQAPIDQVYILSEKIFTYDSSFRLHTKHPLYLKMVRLAERRFKLGHPPRKMDDTTIGDALNWEWVVHCASESQRNVILVSKDKDYGVHGKEVSSLNDWLASEFKERTGDCKITLTQKLSTALEKHKIAVTEAQKKQEQESLDWTALSEKIMSAFSSPPTLSPNTIDILLKSGSLGGWVTANNFSKFRALSDRLKSTPDPALPLGHTLESILKVAGQK